MADSKDKNNICGWNLERQSKWHSSFKYSIHPTFFVINCSRPSVALEMQLFIGKITSYIYEGWVGERWGGMVGDGEGFRYHQGHYA